MKTKVTCEEFRSMLLDPSVTAVERDAFEAHRLACPACAVEAHRDAWLTEALRVLPEEAPPAATWTQVLSAHRPERRKIPLRRTALAFASAAVVFVLLLLHPFQHTSTGPQPGNTVVPPATPGVAVASETTPYTGAHALLSASDMTGDPNRDVILVYGAPSGERG